MNTQPKTSAAIVRDIQTKRADITSRANRIIDAVKSRNPGRNGVGGVGVQESLANSYDLINPFTRKAVYHWSFDYDMPGDDATKAALAEGLIEVAGASTRRIKAGPLGQMDVTTDIPDAGFIGCNTVVTHVRTTIRTNSSQFACSGVLQAVPAGDDPDAIPTPAVSGPVAPSATQTNAQLSYGTQALRFAKLFASCYDLRVSLCGTTVYRKPLRDVCKLETQAGGMSDHMTTTARTIRLLNERLATLTNGRFQFSPTNTDADGGPVQPLILPSTEGMFDLKNPNNGWDCIGPLPASVQQPFSIWLEANPQCENELQEMLRMIQDDNLTPFGPSPLMNPLVATLDGATATTLQAEIWFGSICFIIELSGCQLSNGAYGRFFQTFTPEEAICSGCQMDVQKAVAGSNAVGRLRENSKFDSDTMGRLTSDSILSKHEIERIARATNRQLMPPREILALAGF